MCQGRQESPHDDGGETSEEAQVVTATVREDLNARKIKERTQDREKWERLKKPITMHREKAGKGRKAILLKDDIVKEQ